MSADSAGAVELGFSRRGPAGGLPRLLGGSLRTTLIAGHLDPGGKL